MLTRKIQEESLRTYLFTYSKVYDSISVATLAEMFELDKGEVHAIVSKMIISEELMASLDEPTECMVSGIYTSSKMSSQVGHLGPTFDDLILLSVPGDAPHGAVEAAVAVAAAVGQDRPDGRQQRAAARVQGVPGRRRRRLARQGPRRRRMAG